MAKIMQRRVGYAIPSSVLEIVLENGLENAVYDLARIRRDCKNRLKLL